MTKIVTVFFCCLSCSFAFAGKPLKIEYRLEAKTEGTEYKWSKLIAKGTEAKPRNLEEKPFLTNPDFASFKVKALKSPPAKPETYEIELAHSADGKQKFTTVANQDRDRSFCVVIETEIFQCFSFTPAMKELWNRSSSIYGPFKKSEAKKLVDELSGSTDR